MRILMPLMVTIALAMASCSIEEDSTTQTSAAPTKTSQENERGGVIVVGDERWTLVPQICQVVGRELISIIGHAKEDQSVVLSINSDNSSSIIVSNDDDIHWRAAKETFDVKKVEGRHVVGTAVFIEGYTHDGKSMPGSFDVSC